MNFELFKEVWKRDSRIMIERMLKYSLEEHNIDREGDEWLKMTLIICVRNTALRVLDMKPREETETETSEMLTVEETIDHYSALNNSKLTYLIGERNELLYCGM